MPGDESGSAAGLAAVSASQLQEQREQQPATAAENKAGEQEGRGDVAQKAASPIGPATRDERAVANALLGVSQSPCPRNDRHQQQSVEDLLRPGAPSPFSKRASELSPFSMTLGATPAQFRQYSMSPRFTDGNADLIDGLATPNINGKQSNADGLQRTGGSTRYDTDFVQNLFSSPCILTPQGKTASSTSLGSAIATLPRLPLSTGRETNKRRRPDSIYRNVDSALTGEDEHDDNITAEREAQTTADTSAATLEYVEPESPVQRIPSKYAAHIPTSASQPLGDLVQRRKPLSPIPVPSPLRSLKRARSITRTDYGQQSENNNFADLVETDILETCALRTPGKPMALDQTTRASHVPSTSRKTVSAKDRRQSQACAAYEEEKDLARFGGASEASRGLSEVAATAPPQDASATPRTAQGQRGSNTENSSPPGPKQIGNLEDAIRYSREVAARPPKPRSATRHQPCHCKRSQCLKLYCECFSLRLYCAGCNCLNCANTQVSEPMRANAVKAVLERNPLAFAPKIVRAPAFRGAGQQAQHNKGCACKKSGCLKRYCECFLSEVHCGPRCKCNKCKNFAGSDDLKRRREVIASYEAQAVAIQKARGHLEKRVRGMAQKSSQHVKFEQRGIAEKLLKQPPPKPQVNLNPADDPPVWTKHRSASNPASSKQPLQQRAHPNSHMNSLYCQQQQQNQQQQQQQQAPRPPPNWSRAVPASSSSSSSSSTAKPVAGLSTRPTRHLAQYVEKRIKR